MTPAELLGSPAGMAAVCAVVFRAGLWVIAAMLVAQVLAAKLDLSRVL